MKIAVLTVATNCAYAGVSLENAQKYCDHHGYDFIVKNSLADKEASPHWNKILWLEAVLGDYDFVFLKDCDSIFYTLKNSLEPYLKHPLSVSKQSAKGEMNTGHLMVQNITQNKAMLRAMVCDENGLKENGGIWEQYVFNTMLAQNKISGLVAYEPHIFNAYHFWVENNKRFYSTIKPDTVTVHWPGGCKTEGWVDVMKELSEKM